MNLLQIHSFFREFTINPWIYHLLREFTIIFCVYREFSTNSRDVPLIHYDSTWCSAYLLLIHYLFREFTIKSLIYNEFTIFLTNSSWIQCLVREFTIFHANKPRFHHLLRESTTIFCLYREFSTNSRDVSRIHYELSILQIQNKFNFFFAN